MKLVQAASRGGTLGLGTQARAFRYRGNADMDTATPWYWMPMEAPNYSQLPERYDCYMFNGFGQEMPRFFYNISPNGEHDRMGRFQGPFLASFGVMIFVLTYVWGWGKLVTIMRQDEDYYNVTKLHDTKKFPFDNNYLRLAGARPNDPNYQAHIKSTGTY